MCDIYDENDILNWYVIQTISGNENKIKAQILKIFPDEYICECFIPMYEKKKKYEGRWHINEERLFPGYIFLKTDYSLRIMGELFKVSGFKKFVKTGDEFLPLNREEAQLIDRLIGKEKVVKMSFGIIENDTVTITEGPLMGLEGNIKKIDRHKRIATLQVEVFGSIRDVKCGLEIIKKI